MDDSCRNLIFISHANPADNDVTLWLSSRLSASGYSVWADLLDLRAGGKLWREIESKIRTEAARVIVVSTNASREAEGVENEINIAKGAEKDFQLENFIIQLVLEDLPFTQLHPGLNNRLAISLKNGWHQGLRELVSELEAAEIPRSEVTPETEDYFKFFVSKADALTDTGEPSFASWLPIDLPETVRTYEITSRAKTIAHQLTEDGIPAYSHANYVVTFAIPEVVSYSSSIEQSHLRVREFKVTDWLTESVVEGLNLDRGTRRSTLNGVLNAAWLSHLANEGFSEIAFSNETAYYLRSPDVLTQQYKDPLGRQTRPIRLVGKTKRYEAFWHAAISAAASLRPEPHYSIRLHVAFSTDGKTLIADGDRAFRMRKSFCRNFWNGRWRKIFFAMFERISNGHSEFVIGTGGESQIQVRGPYQFDTPYSIKGDPSSSEQQDTDDDQEDEQDFILDLDDQSED